MLGDGKTAYDHDKDNEANEVGACSVGTLWPPVAIADVCRRTFVDVT